MASFLNSIRDWWCFKVSCDHTKKEVLYVLINKPPQKGLVISLGQTVQHCWMYRQTLYGETIQLYLKRVENIWQTSSSIWSCKNCWTNAIKQGPEEQSGNAWSKNAELFYLNLLHVWIHVLECVVDRFLGGFLDRTFAVMPWTFCLPMATSWQVLGGRTTPCRYGTSKAVASSRTSRTILINLWYIEIYMLEVWELGNIMRW